VPNSQSSDADNGIDDSNANNKLVQQENQTLLLTKGAKTTEQIRLEEARTINLLCFLLVVISAGCSVIAFCFTKSVFSFGFLTLLSSLPSIRRRKEEAIFPISPEDLQIRMKELDVEMERAKKQDVSTKPLLFTWLKRTIGRR
jgi:hypothetical protein